MVPMRRAKWQSTSQGGNSLSLLAARQSHGRSPRAQQPKWVRRIGMLMTLTADDPEGRARLAMFVQGLEEAG
jgi:hypothetical protein